MIASLAIFTMALGGAAQAQAQSISQLYAAAQKEGELVLYMGGKAEGARAVGAAFEGRFPGITVRSFSGGSSGAVARKIEELKGQGKLDADVTVLQTVQNFVRWRQQHALLPFKPAGFDAIADAFKDKNGFFVGVQVIPAVYVYNRNLVAPDDVPKSPLDFLNPKFKGKVITTDPLDDDAALYVFYSIVSKYGWEYMDRYMANEPKFVQESHASIIDRIAAGDAYVTFDPGSNIAAAQAAGYPIEVSYPTDDAIPLWWGAAAIFKGAAHPNAAKLFVTWLLSEERQSANTWSPRVDMKLAPGLRPMSSLRLVDGYPAFLLDDDLLAALRVRFGRLIGPNR